MNNRKLKIAASAVAVLATVYAASYTAYSSYLEKRNALEVMAVTGATPLAFAKRASSELSLKFSGLVKKEYELSGDALNAFASTRIRTKEISPDGRFLGTYIYVGIPLFNIMEGVAPKKADNAVFDKPYDILVTFASSGGEKRFFSYAELTMTDDSLPVFLAFYREQLLPNSKPEKYKKNVFKDNIKGLKLVCPGEPDTSRYLDDVVSITFTVPETPVNLLPVTRKRVKCSSGIPVCIKNGKVKEADFRGMKLRSVKDWVRVGHGHGYYGIKDAKGYMLRSFIKRNFTDSTSDTFFMFVGCDGYRCLFSGREIFSTENGRNMMIIKGKWAGSSNVNLTLAPVTDYYIDRALKGLSHIVMLDSIR